MSCDISHKSRLTIYTFETSAQWYEGYSLVCHNFLFIQLLEELFSGKIIRARPGFYSIRILDKYI
jgi:hypothetical protein